MFKKAYFLPKIWLILSTTLQQNLCFFSSVATIEKL